MKQIRNPFGLRMPPQVRDWIIASSKADGRSANNFILMIIAAEMESRVAQSALTDGE